MVLIWSPLLLQTMERMAYIVVAFWLSFVGVGVVMTAGSTGSSSQLHHQPPWTETGNHASISAAGSTFGAMMARRNHSVLPAGIGRSTGGISIAASRSDKKLLSYQQSPGVATSGASSQRVPFSLGKFGMAFVDVATPQRHRQVQLP